MQRGREKVTVLTDLDSSEDGDYRSRQRNIRWYTTRRQGRIKGPGPSTPSTEPQSSEASTQAPSSASSFGRGPRLGDSTRRLLVISEKPFIPSPMEEDYLPPPQPIVIRSHDESEFTEEQRPLIARTRTPEEQQARMMYYRSGKENVPSYNL